MSARVVTEALPRIGRAELLERQERLRAAARERGLAGVLVWSRGASTQDRYADVLYFTNFYSHFPFLPDEAGRWSARGHAALVVPAEGASTLIVDVTTFRDDLAAADRVVSSEDVVGAAAAALRDTVGAAGDVGILGGETLSWRWHAALCEAVPNGFVDADDLGPQLRLVKSEAEQRLLRAAGLVGVAGVEAVMDAAVPGATEAEVAAAGFDAVLRAGGMVYGISLSTGPYAHTYSQSQAAPFDGRRVLEEGDMARVDLYGSVDGYLFDFGRSRVVGRAPDEDQQALLDAPRDGVLAGVEAVRPGVTLGDVARRCDEVFERSDYVRRSLGIAPAFASWGHSLGLNWEAPWIDADSAVALEPGMCLAIEKRVAAPGIGGATYEENVLVTDAGYELLSDARRAYGEG